MLENTRHKPDLSDFVKMPHRQLTEAEFDLIFCTLSDQVSDWYRASMISRQAERDQVKHRISTGGTDPDAARRLLDAETAAESLQIEQETALTIQAYLAGQRSGMRLGVNLALLTMRKELPTVEVDPARLVVAMIDDTEADALISSLIKPDQQ